MGRNDSIQLRIKIDPKQQAEKDLKQIIEKLNKSEINLKISDSFKNTIETLSKTLDVLYGKANKSISLNGLTRSAEQSAKVFNDLGEQIGKLHEKSNLKIDTKNASQEAKAVNRILNDNYKASLKEAENQKQVNALREKEIRLLELKKSQLNGQYGDKIDTSYIDKSINKLKSLDNISLKGLKGEISNVKIGIREISEQAKQSEGILSRFSHSLQNIGIYFNGNDIFRFFINGAKDAVKYVVDVENSMIDLRRVVDMTDESAKNFQSSMHNVSVDLASNNKDTIETVANFAKLGYSLDEATDLGKVTTKFNLAADINDMNLATTSLISTLKGFGLEANQAGRATDEINEISNKYAVTAKDIDTVLAKSSATLGTFNNSLEESIALGSSANEIMQNSDTVGQALKSIAPRLTTNTNALKQLKKMNIEIEDQYGNLKSTYQLFKEISQKWGDLKGADLANASNNLFGKQNISTGLAIIKNAKQLDNIMKDIKNSARSVDEEFNRYLDSTQAKFTQFKENLGGLYSQFINSDITKGTVDGLNAIVTGITSVVSKIGSINTVLMTVTASLTLFNKKFRESLTGFQPTAITNFISKVRGISEESSKVRTSLQNTINSQKVHITELKKQGEATKIAKKELKGYQTELALTTVKQGICTASAIAMEAVFSMGLSLGIGLAITGLTKLGSALLNTKGHMESCSEQVQLLSNSINQSKSDNDLFKQAEELNNQLKETNLTETKRAELNSKIATIKQQLSSSESEYADILNNENLTLDEQIEKMKLIQKQKLFDESKKLDKDMGSQGSFEKEARDLNELSEKYNKLKSAIQNGDTKITLDILGTSNLENAKKELDDMHNNIVSKQNDITKYNNSVNNMKKVDYSTQRSTIVLGDAVRQFNENIKDNTSNLKDNTNAKQENRESLGNLDNEANAEEEKAQAIAQATQEYNKSTQEIAKITGWIEKMNKTQTVTPAIARQVAKAYDDVGTSVNDVGSLTEFLNDKIQNQVEAQQEALMVMKGDDEQFYQDKIVNNQSYEDYLNGFLNRFVGNSNDNYNVDLSNYKTLNELKSGSMDELQVAVDEWLSKYIDTSNQNYSIDYSNFENLVSAKSEILKQFAGSMAQFWDDASGGFTQQAYGGIDLSGHDSQENYDKYTQQAQGILDMKNKINSAYADLDKIYVGGKGLNLQGAVSGGTSGGKFGSGGSGGSGKGSKEKSGSGSKEKEVADLKIELDLYELQKNKIEQVTNALEENKDKQDSLLTTEEERQSLMVEELQLYQDKWVKLNNLAGSYDQERRSLESYLRSQNLEIDALGNILNKNQILKEWEDWANASSGEEKERRIQQTKDLQKEIENYSKIVQTELPKVEKEWREVGKSMQEASMKMVSKVRDKLIEALKKDIEDKEKLAEKANEEEKKSKIDKLDKQIKKLKKELADLDDDEVNKRKKLEALKRELGDWRKDNSTESTKKQQELQKSISELEKELEKDALKNKIEKLEEKKNAVNKHYEKESEETKTHYDDLLKEQEIYNKANKMMQDQNMQEVLKIIGKYDDSFKELGVLFGENMADALTSQVENALRQLAQVTGTEVKNDSSKWVADTGDHVKVNDVGVISVFSNPNGTSDSVKGTLSQQNINNGQEMVAKKYNNGFLLLETSDGDEIGWVDRHLLKKYNDIPKFATGGLIKTNSKEEKLGFLGDGEQVLQPQATKDMHDTFELVKDIQPLMESLQEIANKIDTNQLALYMNRINQPMNYMPNMTDLNRINSSVINNSTSNSVREGDISIQQTYNVTARSDFEEKKFANNLDRQFSATLRNAGLKK